MGPKICCLPAKAPATKARRRTVLGYMIAPFRYSCYGVSNLMTSESAGSLENLYIELCPPWVQKSSPAVKPART